MIRLSMLFLGGAILVANAEQDPRDNYSLAEPIHLCNRFKKDRVPTAQDVAVAVDSCSKALIIYTDALAYARLITNRASAYNAIGEYDRAIADLNQAIKRLLLAKQSTKLHLERSNESPKKIDEALKYNNELLVRAFSDRNGVYRAKKEYDRAIVWWSKLLRLNPEDTAVFNKLALVYGHDEKYYDRAITNATTFMGSWISSRSTVGFADIYYQRANAYSVKGQPDRAIADYSDAIRANPSYHLAFTNRGLVYARHKQDYDRAIADFDEAIRWQPRNAYALTCRGLAYKAKGASDLASADLEAAEGINSDVKKIAEQQWQLMARLQSP